MQLSGAKAYLVTEECIPFLRAELDRAAQAQKTDPAGADREGDVELRVLLEDGLYRGFDRFLLSSDTGAAGYWAQNVWERPFVFEFDSISDAAKQLSAIQRNWWAYSHKLHRRTRLIQEALPSISPKPRVFPFSVPASPMGGFMLLDEHRLIASAECSSPFPGGDLVFAENKDDPPSTAYLKLWEAMTRLGKTPDAGQLCMDVGACPGGWSWVMLQAGASVIALDRSPLDPRIMKNPRLDYRGGNAFAVKHSDVERLDWLCSDIIAYPDKLYEWLQPWLDSGKVGQFVVTLKMQGEPDWKSIDAFAAIPDSLVYHGSYNKHELTWLHPAPSRVTLAKPAAIA